MTLAAVGLFLLGFAASWLTGRYVSMGAQAIQGGAIGFCGVAALLYGMPQLWEDQLFWALGALLVYGIVGALIFRAGQAARERAE
jgi:hypothetical protein